MAWRCPLRAPTSWRPHPFHQIAYIRGYDTQQMRVYHFLSAKYALDDIKHRRLKIATFDDLNDPYELWAVGQPDRQLRRGLRRWKAIMTRDYGMLCFSRGWRNPLLWSHYADRHGGMVLGFDVNDVSLKYVKYVTERPVFTNIDERTVQDLLFTKFKDWQYEQETRVFTRLQERDRATRLYFADFTEDLRLREVISGPLCTTTKSRIEEALRHYEGPVTLTKARLGFTSFQIVKNKKGFT